MGYLQVNSLMILILIMIITCLFCHIYAINTIQCNIIQCSMSNHIIETITSIMHHANLLLTMLTSYHDHTPLSSSYSIPTDHLIQKKEDKVMKQSSVITYDIAIGTALVQLSHHNHQPCIVLVSIVPTRSNYCIFLCRTSY